MERQFIKVSIEDRVAVVTIDHPPANALNTQTVTELNDAIDELAANPGVKAIVITGGGAAASSLNVFIAGADIGDPERAGAARHAQVRRGQWPGHSHQD